MSKFLWGTCHGIGWSFVVIGLTGIGDSTWRPFVTGLVIAAGSAVFAFHERLDGHSE